MVDVSAGNRQTECLSDRFLTLQRHFAAASLGCFFRLERLFGTGSVEVGSPFWAGLLILRPARWVIVFGQAPLRAAHLLGVLASHPRKFDVYVRSDEAANRPGSSKFMLQMRSWDFCSPAKRFSSPADRWLAAMTDTGGVSTGAKMGRATSVGFTASKEVT